MLKQAAKWDRMIRQGNIDKMDMVRLMKRYGMKLGDVHDLAVGPKMLGMKDPSVTGALTAVRGRASRLKDTL